MKETLSTIESRIADIGDSVKHKANDAAESAKFVARNASEAVTGFLKKTARTNPRLRKVLTPVVALRDQLSVVAGDVTSAFDTQVQIQVDDKAVVGWVTEANRAGDVIFDNASSQLASAGQTVIFESADRSYLKLRCGKLHAIELELRTPDGLIFSADCVLSLNRWAVAKGPHGQEVRIVRCRRRDAFGLASYPHTDHGPGKMRLVTFIKFR